jgi:hypothetical protein
MEFSQGLTLVQRVNTIERMSRWARASFSIWKTVEDLIDPDGSMNDLEQWKPFLLVDGHIHRDVALLYLHNLYERRKDTINILSMIRHFKAHGLSEAMLDLEVSLRAYDLEIRKLGTIRGFAIGHRTTTESYDEVFARAKLGLNDVDDLIDLAQGAAKTFAMTAGVTAPASFVDPAEVFVAMLHKLSADQ